MKNCLSLTNNICENIIYLPSDNFNDRPVDTNIDLLVIHSASLPEGEYDNDYIERLFTNKLSNELLEQFNLPQNLKVSSHVYINRAGTIIQFVPFDKRAWHAGESEFMGRTNCNDFSIGIELQGTDTSDFTKAQYDSLINITKVIIDAYPSITKTRANIVGHSDIAPSRKTDPGNCFNWDYYLDNL